MTSPTTCPFCGQELPPADVPAPDCPSCGRAIDAQREVSRRDEAPSPAGETRTAGNPTAPGHQSAPPLIERRRLAAEQLLQLRKAGIQSVRVHVTADSTVCPCCHARKDEVVDIRRHGTEALPPWDDCTHGEGCRCWFSAIDEYVRAADASVANADSEPARSVGGCLGGAATLAAWTGLVAWGLSFMVAWN